MEKVSQHIYDDNELKEVRAKAPDMKESFECGWEDYDIMPNIWLPEDVLPGFKEACMDFYWVRCFLPSFPHKYPNSPSWTSRHAMKRKFRF